MRYPGQLVAEHPFFRDQGPHVVAHRGGAGLWPENTLFAFESALAIGADWLELDVHLSADGTLVVIHDETVERTTHGQGEVSALKRVDLQALDAGYNWTADGGATYPYRGQGITIPTLEDIFAAFPERHLFVEIKPDETAVAAALCKLIREFGREDRTLVGSFKSKVVKEFRQMCPEVATAATPPEAGILFILYHIHSRPYRYRPAEACVVSEYAEFLHLVTRKFVNSAGERNVRTYVWTVNEGQQISDLLALGVDGIISDYPDRVLAALGR